MNAPGRAGRYVQQPHGYRAFVPRPLPPEPPLIFDAALLALLSEADQALARLDAATEFLPNPDLFVRMYVRKEAVLSAQIEGTQASLADLLEHEAKLLHAPDEQKDLGEVVNYVRAMSYGLKRLATMPLSLRLFCEIHAELLKNVRGGEKTPGAFRRSQNWIGSPGSTLADAQFVPPPPGEVAPAMGDLEKFLHDELPLPVLVRAALAHSQLETIHPFLDGNGRMGRLLVTFLLCARGALKRPTLYLSHYFKRHRDDYYRHLQGVRDHGDFEGWLRFFLEGVRDVAKEGKDTARRILELREAHRRLVGERLGKSSSGHLLLDCLFEHPVVDVSGVAKLINRTYPAANTLVERFVGLRLLRQISEGERNRVFRYEPYVAIFGELRP